MAQISIKDTLYKNIAPENQIYGLLETKKIVRKIRLNSSKTFEQPNMLTPKLHFSHKRLLK